LRHFPGPQLCAAYRFPYVIENVRGRLPQKVLELHQKYGPVVRIAPNELAFAQAEAWNDIYGLQPGRIQHQKDRASYLPPEDRDFGAGLIHASDGAHARLRRIFGQAFTPKALEGMSGTLIKYSDMLVEQLRLAVGNYPVQDISAWFNFTTFDLTGEFALGEAFHCLEKGGQSHFFLDAVLGGIVIGCQIWQLERYGLWTLMEPFLRNSIMKKRYRMASFTRDIVDQRLKNGFIPGSNDVLNYLLENKRPEDHLPASEIYRNAITLVVAGSETTATLLSGVLSLLGGHQDVLVRVQQEVRSAFESNNDITPASVNKLPYMLAVLSESARLFPASPWGFPRIISSKTGQTVAGHWVPEGVCLYT
jgi:cytochrome P450